MKKRLVSLLLAIVMVCGIMPSAFAASDKATQAADALYELGLFKGTGTNADGTPIYDLDKTPTRNQAIIMLVRLLGKEEEALAGTWSIPFTDVTDNMKPYIGYAYTNGLTNGTSATTYSGTNPIRANQYIAFVLRALGYESGKDFEVSTSYTLSNALGITNGEYSGASAFTRGDVAIISNNALAAKLKGQDKALKETLNLQNNGQNNQQAADQNKEDAQQLPVKNDGLQGTWLHTKSFGGIIEYTFDGDSYYRVTTNGKYLDDIFYSAGTYSVENGQLILNETQNFWIKNMNFAAINDPNPSSLPISAITANGFTLNTLQFVSKTEEAYYLRYTSLVDSYSPSFKDQCYSGTAIKTVTAVTGAKCTGSYKKVNDIQPVSKEYVAGCPRYLYDVDLFTGKEEVFIPYIEYLDSVGTRIDSGATTVGDKDSLLQVYGNDYTYSVGGKNITVSYFVGSATYKARVAIYFL